MSYYTKYRPQKISELDLVAVRESLSAILKSGKFSHAYLFTGPKGTGKTSSARIVAKVLNCDANNSLAPAGRSPLKMETTTLSEPCNVCENCRRITAGSSLSCIEMDAASNRGIDDIRGLRERVGLAPSEGKYTVYIIDEVHMLTPEAFNALLKTLEEPPEHAVFILCTTDPQKIPETVISRCTRIHFQKASAEEVKGSIQKAVMGEGLEIEDKALEKIAESVDGSFRDGMKLLEQLAQQTGGKIELTQVLTAVGADEDYNPQKLYAALTDGEVRVALAELALREKNGVDLNVYGKRLLEMIRGELLCQVEREGVSLRQLIALAEVVDQAIVRLKGSALPQLVFEAMVVGWCVQKDQSPKVKIQKVVEEKKEEKRETIVVAKDLFQGKLEEVREKWQMILAAVKPLNHSLEALLRSAQPKSVDNGVLRIEAFYKFHKEQLEQDRHRQKLEVAMSSVLGGKILLEIVLGEQRSNKLEAVGVENISGSVEDEALVKVAEEIFG